MTPMLSSFPMQTHGSLIIAKKAKEDLPEVYNNHSGRFRHMALSLSSFSNWGLED